MSVRNLVCFTLISFALSSSVSFGEVSSSNSGVSDAGLQLRYSFESIDDGLIRDQSANKNAIDLRPAKLDAVRQSRDGLEIISPTLIRSSELPKRLVSAIKGSSEFSVVGWIRPANLKQAGPARILTLSRNSSERNFTLGQDGDRVEVRLRTTKTSTNGLPSITSQKNRLKTQWTHIVFTFSSSGQATLFINGKFDVQTSLGGQLTNWDLGYSLAVGNELSNDRPWLGKIRSLSIHDRVLSADEVQQNFKAGYDSSPETAEQVLAKQVTANSRLFETKIAPLISANCLECHDAATKQGGLDLSRKQFAITGGDSGSVLMSGDIEHSLLWNRVVSDEMPENRDPLTADDKKLLKQWIEGGASWSLDFIDPAIYGRSNQLDKVYLQRLTVPEYIESVRSVLDVDIEKEATQALPRDVRADGFSNTAYNLTVDLAHIEAYAKLAEVVVNKLDTESIARRYTKSREMTSENLTKIIEPMGLKLLRGPLGKDETAFYCGVSTTVAASGGNFEESIQYVLEAMLQSPRFIYRIEAHAGGGETRPVKPFELVSRLSYIICGAPPDDELLQFAKKGELDSATIDRQVQRLLKDPRAIKKSLQFISEWLNLPGLNNLRPDPVQFPNWDPQLASDMRAETLAYFEEVAWRRARPLNELMNEQVTFVTPRLARHYGLPLTKKLSQASDDELVRYDLKEIPTRGGLLTHGSILTKGGDEASMVTRGLFVMNELLRGVVRDPPPCVDTTPQPSKPGISQRMVAETRLANQGCVGCHAKFEPLAFGLERYDGLGSYHEKDEFKNPLREDGEVLFPGDEQAIKFSSSAQLMKILADSERVRESFTWKVTQFALGRPLDAGDASEVSRIHRVTYERGGTYRDLIAAIATSELVRVTRTEPNSP